MFQIRWHLFTLALGLILLVLSFAYDWRCLFGLLTLVAGWLLRLGKALATLSLENGEVLMRHDLGWVVGRASLEGVTSVIFHMLPIPPGAMRMHVRNGRLHIDASRVHKLCISSFVEQVKESGLQVDSSRIRKGAFDKKAPRKIKFKFPGSR
ncbi:MAG: hypothetical protein MUP90_12040 [Gammaproteobacteria bacterium]|nr:hypothetical protein [Gammaproteobacteria bacterium]